MKFYQNQVLYECARKDLVNILELQSHTVTEYFLRDVVQLTFFRNITLNDYRRLVNTGMQWLKLYIQGLLPGWLIISINAQIQVSSQIYLFIETQKISSLESKENLFNNLFFAL